MKIIAGTKPWIDQKLVHQPFVRYIVKDCFAPSLGQRLVKEDVFLRGGAFNQYEHRFPGKIANGRSIMLYRGGSLGDEMIFTALIAYLHYRWPNCAPHVWVHPRFASVYHGLPCHILHYPIPFEAARSYDYHVFGEDWYETDWEPEQANAYDAMYAMHGMNPKRIPREYKRPHLVAKDDDNPDWKPDHPYIIYNWSASVVTRTYPFERGIQVIKLLRHVLPDVHVYVTGTSKIKETNDLILRNTAPDDGIHPCINTIPSWRAYIPMVQGASLVIGPDSMWAHLTGAFPSVPFISLLGPFGHHDRAFYYPNVVPLHPVEVCPHAPCHTHKEELPREWCNDVKEENRAGGENYCHVLASISPKQIVETAMKILT